MWMRGALGQDACDNAGRQCPSALILLLDNLHKQTGVDLTALGWRHELILSLSYHHTTVQGVRMVHVQGVSDDPDPVDGTLNTGCATIGSRRRGGFDVMSENKIVNRRPGGLPSLAILLC